MTKRQHYYYINLELQTTLPCYYYLLHDEMYKSKTLDELSNFKEKFQPMEKQENLSK